MIWLVLGIGCALVGLAVAGIVAAIAIPNFIDAMQRAKQKRTVAELRTIAAAIVGRQAERGTLATPATVEDLRPLLAEGGYTGTLVDGWEHPLRYTCLQPEDGRCRSYELSSPGKDGTFEQQPGVYESGAFQPNQYDSDIVVSDGVFVRFPEWQQETPAIDGAPEAAPTPQ